MAHSDGLIERLAAAKPTRITPLAMHVIDVTGKEHDALALNEVSLFRTTYQAVKLEILVDGKTQMEELIREFLKEIGEDPTREGLERTPERVAKAWRYFTSGYEQNVANILNSALFTENYDEMVVVKDIDLYSMCEHHLLPFFGKCHIAYMPSNKIAGLSKLPRLVEMFSRRLQVQERLTTQIAQTLQDVLQPRGVAVVVEALHMCMLMRGVEKQNSKAVTSAMLGAFRDRPETRAEFMELIKSRGGLVI